MESHRPSHILPESQQNTGFRDPLIAAAPLEGSLGRQAVAKIRSLKQAELEVEDGEDIATAAANLIDDHLSGDLGKVR